MATLAKRVLPGVAELGTIRIATGATTIDQFIAAFHPYCDAASCFIPTPDVRPIGFEAQLIIELANGLPVLVGVCAVLDSWAHADNRFARAGVLLHLRRLTNDSKPIYDRLLAGGAAELSRKTLAIAPIEFYESEDSITPTIAMVPLTAPITAADGVPKLVREPGSAGLSRTAERQCGVIDERDVTDCTVTVEPTERMRRPTLRSVPMPRLRAIPPTREPAHRPRMVVPALARPGSTMMMRAIDPLDIALALGAAGIAAILAILVIALTAPR